jgi:hypothetical protein
LKPSDFTTKIEDASKNRKGRREYLNDKKTREMMRDLQDYLRRGSKFLLSVTVKVSELKR